MNKKQIEEIIKAILARQYSWACVLMLRFNGYDPLNYIPYRTYIRLLKNNYQLNKNEQDDSDNASVDLVDLKTSGIRLVEGGQVNIVKHDSNSIPVGQCQPQK
jgi:hypothetical protein